MGLISLLTADEQNLCNFIESNPNTKTMSKLVSPLNIKAWIEENRVLLKPPVGNKCVWNDGEFIVMVVGGPNNRKDYHYNETEELFFQLEGDILVKTQQNGKCVDVHIKEGEMFLLPAKIPHSPIRSANSVGLVIERKRKPHHKDGLMWFSEKENALLYDEYFHLTNIEKDFLPVFRKFYSDEKLRTCPVSGEIMEADERFI